MAQASSTSRYILTALAIILVITAFILVGLNALQLQNKGGGLGLSLLSQQTDQAYKDGYLAARQKYHSICALPPSSNLIIGSVVSNDGRTLRIKQQNLDTDPQVDGVDDIRSISLSSSSTIMQITRKTPQQIATETVSPAAEGQPSIPPSIYTEHAIQLSEIKTGMLVTIQSASDVRLASSIVANRITVTQ